MKPTNVVEYLWLYMIITLLTYLPTTRDHRASPTEKRPHEHTNPTDVRVGEDLHGIVTLGHHAGGKE